MSNDVLIYQGVVLGGTSFEKKKKEIESAFSSKSEEQFVGGGGI